MRPAWIERKEAFIVGTIGRIARGGHAPGSLASPPGAPVLQGRLVARRAAVRPLPPRRRVPPSPGALRGRLGAVRGTGNPSGDGVRSHVR